MVQVESAPVPRQENESGPAPAMAWFATSPTRWHMSVVANSIGAGRSDVTLSLNPDLSAVIESMFRRLEQHPEVTFTGEVAELNLYTPSEH